MRDLRQLNKFRFLGGETMLQLTEDATHLAGSFIIPSPFERLKNMRAVPIRVIASSGLGYPWDHVSVSTPKRCPTWEEMDHVKRLFFEEHETAMQLHVPPADHINNHPYCLHIWRPHGQEIPRPPGIMVGVAGAGPEDVQRIREQIGL